MHRGTIKWPKRDTLRYTAVRRGGYSTGISVFRKDDQTLTLYPLNSYDNTGPCSIDIPMDYIGDVIRMLDEMRRPPIFCPYPNSPCNFGHLFESDGCMKDKNCKVTRLFEGDE